MLLDADRVDPAPGESSLDFVGRSNAEPVAVQQQQETVCSCNFGYPANQMKPGPAGMLCMVDWQEVVPEVVVVGTEPKLPLVRLMGSEVCCFASCFRIPSSGRLPHSLPGLGCSEGELG